MRAIAVAAVVAIAPAGALAADRIRFDIPPGPLAVAIIAIGDHAGVTIGLVDPALGAIRVAGFRGEAGVATVLSRLLRGTPARLVRIDAATYRIVRGRPLERAPLPIVAPTASAGEIIVTGSKRDSRLVDYPGSADLIDVAALRGARLASGSAALVDRAPVLSSTHLGPGRDKLFIRGIADSSFNGPSQVTVGEYLGDVRLNYADPDPDLALYDMRSIEVLEGPQGTLYGAGTLGGVVRFVPVPPDLARSSATISAGASATAHGTPGEDSAAILNLPLITGRAALRVVGYSAIAGGYIDDPSRGRSNINRTVTFGGRATLRVVPAPGWTIDLGAVLQNINSRDGQYATRGLPPLQRASVIAQPFDNDYSLGSLVVRHDAGGTAFLSASSAVFHDTGSTYDASPSAAAPTRYREHSDVALFTNETRLSHQGANGSGWVVGTELLRSADRLRRSLGPLGAEAAISGTRNVVEQAALFGEATVRLAPRWFVTGGGRLGYTRRVEGILGEPGDRDDQRRRNLVALPSAGVLWKPGDGLSVYARFQQGFRPGGIAVQASATQRFEGDSVATWEAGMRYGSMHSRFGGSAAVSYTHWEDIQADLVATDGLPYTTNIGSGRIAGVELRMRWRPIDSLAIDGALFADDSKLAHPRPGFIGERDASLPNIPDLSGRLGLRYVFPMFGTQATLDGSIRYVGRSRLGVGPVLDLHQGRYFDTALGLDMPIGAAIVSFDATNLLGERRNIFALGDPFGVGAATQETPLRPRTVRLGIAMSF